MNLLLSNDKMLNTTDIEYLTGLGYTVFTDPTSAPLTEIDVLVDSGLFSKYKLTDFPNLKFLQITSAGYDYLDFNYIKEKGMIFCNGRDLYSIPIAEFTIARILEYAKELRIINEDQKNKHWEKRFGFVELHGQKALILGTGSIGYETAIRLQAFGVTVDGVNSNGRSIEPFNACFSLDSCKSVLGEYDYIINALPLNDQTMHFVNKDFIESMKDSAVLINVGRGKTVNETDLIKLLDTHLSAVILDVVEKEPLDDNSPLWNHPKVFLSSHTSFGSTENKKRTEALYLNNCTNYIQKKKMMNQIL